MDEIIRFENVIFQYNTDQQQDRPALGGIDFAIKQGEFVAVLGYNGSGKSTLAKHMNAILVPTSGKVTVCGMDSADDQNLYAIREQVGMVFQNPDNQIVATVVEEDVAFALENLGVAPPEIRRRVDEALEVVGMQNHKTAAPHRLSGGQKQRVAIAGILAMQPQCIVLDEPTAMLDPLGREKILRTVKKLNRENGITVVLITHYMEEAAQADRVVIMSEGKIAKCGTPPEVFSNVAEICALELDVPQTTELCDILHREGIPIEKDLVSPDECVAQLAALLEANKNGNRN